MGEAGGPQAAGPERNERGSHLAVALTALGFVVLLSVAGTLGRGTLQVGQARRELSRRFGLGLGGALPPPHARPPPQLPKVALLFLTRGNLPYEPAWRAFLESATAAVQLAAPPGVSPADWRQLFSLYTHPPPGHTHPAGSLFEGHEVPDRAVVQWGDHSMMDAERALLRAALGDPLNQRFVLVSDSCIPLWPAPAVWVELMGESRSRTHFCKGNPSDPEEHERNHMAHRWQQGMQEYGVEKLAWRKGSQWFMMVRRHAEIVSADTQADAAFRKECFATGWDPAPPPEQRRDCISDEHFIPTLLVLLGLEEETLCSAFTFVFWGEGGAHPYSFYAKDAVPAKLQEFRGGDKCNASAVLVPESVEVLRRVWQPPSGSGEQQQLWKERSSDLLRLQAPQEDGGNQQQQQQQNSSSSAPAAPAPAAAAAAPPRITDLMLGEGALGAMGGQLIEWCPLLARKLDPATDAVAAWTQLLARDFNVSSGS